MCYVCEDVCSSNPHPSTACNRLLPIVLWIDKEMKEHTVYIGGIGRFITVKAKPGQYIVKPRNKRDLVIYEILPTKMRNINFVIDLYCSWDEYWSDINCK